MVSRLASIAAAALVGAAVAGSLASARADEIADEIRNALTLYEQGKTAEAKEALDFAAQLLAQKKAGGLEAFFPKPLDGWTVEDSGSSAVAAGFGGITAAKSYAKDDETVEITIIGDSPMMQGLAMMFGNPALAGSSGARMQRIKGQRALIGEDGEIQIMAGKFFVTIAGSAPEAAKLQYANAFPFDELSKF